jgi:hypothetical protein
MATICDNPFSIPAIDLDECIGTSLATINANFQELKQLDCLTFNEIERLTTAIDDLSGQASSYNQQSISFAKAWVNFNIVNGTPIINSSFNVKEVRALSTGTYALSFTTAFPTVSYALVGTCSETGIAPGGYVWAQPTTFATTSANINIRNQSGTLTNPEYVSIIIYNK